MGIAVILIAVGPEPILARLLGYRRHAFLDVPEERREDVKLKFA